MLVFPCFGATKKLCIKQTKVSGGAKPTLGDKGVHQDQASDNHDTPVGEESRREEELLEGGDIVRCGFLRSVQRDDRRPQDGQKAADLAEKGELLPQEDA